MANTMDYSSINNLNIEQRLPYIINPKSDPTKFVNGFDMLNSGMYQLSQSYKDSEAALAKDPAAQERFQQALKGFYARIIYPAYQKMQQRPPDPDMWVRGAPIYLKNFDVNEMYKNHLTYGPLAGLSKFISDTVQIPKTVAGLYNYAVLKASGLPGDKSIDGFWNNVDTAGKTLNLLYYKDLSKKMDQLSDRFTLYDELRPVRNSYDTAGKLLGEAYGFIATWGIAASVLPGTAIIGEESAAALGNGLRGRIATNYARAYIDGLTYGGATERFENKSKAFDDAAKWALFSVPMTVAGAGIRYFGGKFFKTPPPPPKTTVGGFYTTPTSPKGLPKPSPKGLPETGTLEGEYIGEPEAVYPTPAGVTVKDAEYDVTTHANRVRDGRRLLTAGEMKDVNEQSSADVLMQGGAKEQAHIDNAAAQYMLDLEKQGLSFPEIYNLEKKMITEGPESNKDMLSSVLRIRSIIRDKALSSLSVDERATIAAQLQLFSRNVAGKLVKYSPGLQTILKNRIKNLPPGSIDMNLITSLAPRIMQKLGPNASPQQIEAAAKDYLGALSVEAHKFADDRATRDRYDEVSQVEANRKQFLERNPEPVTWLEKSRRGKPEVNPSWKIYAKHLLGGKSYNESNINELVRGMSLNNFVTDIQTFFLPKFIRELGLQFDPKYSIKGVDHSNILAFAYNFRDMMPPAYASRLSQELVQSPVLSQFYKDAMQDPKLSAEKRDKVIGGLVRKQALAAWNHVDNFLNSGYFPNQLSAYRATGTYAAHPTEHALDMLADRENHERDMVDAMFKKGSIEHDIASNTLRALQIDRWHSFREGDQLSAKLISDRLTKDLSDRPKLKAAPRTFPKSLKVMPSNLPYTKEQVAARVEFNKRKRKIFDRAEELATAYDQGKEVYKALPPGHETKTQLGGLLKGTLKEIKKLKIERIKAIRDYDAAFGHIQVPARISKGPMGFVNKDRHGNSLVYLNEYAMNALIPNALGANIGNDAEGFLKVITDIQNSSLDDANKLGLYDLFTFAFIKARENDTGVIVYQTGQRAIDLVEAHHEEVTHEWQRFLGKKTGGQRTDPVENHLDREGYERMINLMPEQMLNSLEASGYGVDHDAFFAEKPPNVTDEEWEEEYSDRLMIHTVIEGSAKLICSDPKQYGVHPDQAFMYLWDYFTELTDLHGPDALDSLVTATENIEFTRQEVMRRAKEDYGEWTESKPRERTKYPGVPD